MIYLFRWLFGYVEFEFTGGFCEGFINTCFEQATGIRGVELKNDGLTAFCLIPRYKRLRHIARANGGRLHITAKRGLPFLLRPLRGRLGFFIGAFMFALIISFSGCFIWNVEIVGNERISEAELSQYLEMNGVRTGAMWSGVERSKLCWQMMSDFDDLAWVHINKIGTTARVEVNEARPAPVVDESALQGIKATRRELEAVASRRQSRITVTDTKKYCRIRFFALDLPLYIRRRTADIEEEESRCVTIRGVQLPIGITIFTDKTLKSESYDLTDSELVSLAKRRLDLEVEKELDGVIIINKNVVTALDEGKCVAKGSYVIKMP